MILAVGYRVRSPRGTLFRQWATERLREYLVKGFTMDDERLKRAGGGNYFEELDFAELQARNRRPMYMADWIAKLDDFLRLSERDILTHAGKISHELAVEKAEIEFEQYHQSQAVLRQPVDRHFEQSLNELKQIEQQKKALPEKEPGKRKLAKKKPRPGNDPQA